MLVLWAGFILLILLMLTIDLAVFHKNTHAVSTKEALWLSAVWISLGLTFSVFIYYGYEYHWLGLGSAVDSVDGLVNNGESATLKYLTGYVVEKSLSIDNIFVIALVFGIFVVPPLYQHRVLFWGILGALVMRAAMIFAGTALIARFHWVLYLFALFLIVTGLKMFFTKSEESDLSQNAVVRFARKFFPVTACYHGEHFLVRAGSAASREAAVPGVPAEDDAAVAKTKAGRWMFTPLMLALITVETTDIIFAVDSIPAIFAITADPFLVFTSNVFAILGLRSLYFALAGMLQQFRYLKPALSLVLLLVGIKMLTASYLKELLGSAFNLYLLGAIFLILGAGIGASLLIAPRTSRR